jgi:hypothetical protein
LITFAIIVLGYTGIPAIGIGGLWSF